MWFTLAKGFIWFALALLIGIVLGWLLRSIIARRQLLRARGPQDTSELERLRSRIADLEPVVVERDRLRSELEVCRASASPPAATAGFASMPAPPAAVPSGDLDLASATAVLGHTIALDDLTVVEGIGPKIQGLCHGIGIRTWSDLSTTEVSLLRTMLNDAGPRFRTHDPTTWPQQAGLLAAGQWAEFKALTDELDGGRPPS